MDALDRADGGQHLRRILGPWISAGRRWKRQIAGGPVGKRDADLSLVLLEDPIRQSHEWMRCACGHALNEARQVGLDSAGDAETPDLARKEIAIIRLTGAVAERGFPCPRVDRRDRVGDAD